MTQARHTGFAKLPQKDVSAAIARHEMLFSGRLGGARATFAFCNLAGLDLSGRNLADADFTGAVLEESNFQGAKLDSASFFGADLRRANQSGASLRRTEKRDASMRGANLIGTSSAPFSLVSEAILDQGGSLKTINN